MLCWEQAGFCGGASDQRVGTFLPHLPLERAGNEVSLVNGQHLRTGVLMACYSPDMVILYGSLKLGEHE